MHTIKTYLPPLGRLLLSSLFIWAGIGKLMNPSFATAYFTAVHVPIPDIAVWIAVIIEIGGGVLILIGLQTRWVALALAIYCLGTGAGVHLLTAMGLHDPKEAAARFGDMVNFYKNLVMAGGFLYVVAFGAGGISIDGVDKAA